MSVTTKELVARRNDVILKMFGDNKRVTAGYHFGVIDRPNPFIVTVDHKMIVKWRDDLSAEQLTSAEAVARIRLALGGVFRHPDLPEEGVDIAYDADAVEEYCRTNHVCVRCSCAMFQPPVPYCNECGSTCHECDAEGACAEDCSERWEPAR